jgi:hypothetical protein
MVHIARVICLGLVCLAFTSLPCSAQEKKSKSLVLDWSLVPVLGDDDYKAKAEKLRAMYVGKEIVVENAAMLVSGTSARETIVDLNYPAKRGELRLHATIRATFKDTDPASIRRLADNKTKFAVTGTVVEDNSTSSIMVRPARMLSSKKPR